MQTIEAILTRRSVRGFTPEPLSDEQLELIIRAGAAAPSGGNAQKRVFISVRQVQRIAALRALAPGIIGMPAAVVILCVDNRENPSGRAFSPSLYYDIGAALQNILLAAHDAGLGACPVGSFHAKAVAVFLNLPEGVEPCLLVVVGIPKAAPSAPPRRSLDEIYFQEGYDVAHGNH
jgi:nitroreductase